MESSESRSSSSYYDSKPKQKKAPSKAKIDKQIEILEASLEHINPTTNEGNAMFTERVETINKLKQLREQASEKELRDEARKVFEKESKKAGAMIAELEDFLRS